MPRALLYTLITLCAAQLAGCSVFGPPEHLNFSREELTTPLTRADGSTTTLREDLDARVTLLVFTDATRSTVGGPRRGLDVAQDIAAERDDVKIVEFVRTNAALPEVAGTPSRTRIASNTPMPAHRSGLSPDGDRPTYLANTAGVITLIEPDIRGRLASFEDAAAGHPTAPMLVGLTEAEAIQRYGPPRVRFEDGTMVYDFRNPPHIARTRATVRDGVIVDARTTRRHEAPAGVAFVVPRRSVPLTARGLLGERKTRNIDPDAPGEIVSLTLERVDSGRSVTIVAGSNGRLEPGDYRLSIFVRAKGANASKAREIGLRTLRPGDRVTIDAFEELLIDPDPPRPLRQKQKKKLPPTWEPSPLPFRSAHHPI